MEKTYIRLIFPQTLKTSRKFSGACFKHTLQQSIACKGGKKSHLVTVGSLVDSGGDFSFIFICFWIRVGLSASLYRCFCTHCKNLCFVSRQESFRFSFYYLVIKCIDPKYLCPFLLLTVLSHGHDYFTEGKKILKDQNNYRAV